MDHLCNMERHRFPPFSPSRLRSLCYNLIWVGIALKQQGCLAYGQLSLQNTPEKSLSEITRPPVGYCCFCTAPPLLSSNPTCYSCPGCSPSSANMLNHSGTGWCFWNTLCGLSSFSRLNPPPPTSFLRHFNPSVPMTDPICRQFLNLALRHCKTGDDVMTRKLR